MNAILRYPGSKWRIGKQLVELIPKHHSYVEPYFGSGAVLFNKIPSNIETINDMDGDVINLFRCLQKDEQRLAHLVATTPFSRDVYEYAYSQEVVDPFERALKFLIRCWQGHGFRMTGEKVGWKNDVQGRESSYALQNWCNLPKNILEVSERFKMVQIENRPAIEVIKRFNYENVFMYLDPPYMFDTRKSNMKQYSHEMTDVDHIELLELIKESKAMIMISGYDNDLYNEYLQGWQREEFESNDNTGRRTIEIVWMNYMPTQGQLKLF